MTEPQIPLFRVSMPPREELMPRLERVLYSGMIGEGEEVRRFEERFGAWLGGRVYDATGSYDAIWWASVALGIVAAILHAPIADRTLVRAPAPA